MTAARARDFDRWVQLTLRPDGQRLFIDYADENGERSSNGEPEVIDAAVLVGRPEAGEPARAGLSELAAMFPRVLIASELTAWLRAGFSDRREVRQHLLPDEAGYRSEPVPWLLPVFVRPPAIAQSLPWESWVERLLLRSGQLNQRCVVMREAQLPAPEPLHLPLRIEGIGRGTADWLEAVRRRSWYAQSPAVRRHGLHLIDDDDASYAGSDIVVRQLGTGLSWSRIVHARHRPRLMVTIATGNPWLQRIDAPAPEPGMSHLLIMPSGRADALSAARIVTHVVYALVHDFSLHEIAWIVRHFVPGASTWLATSAKANRALRLSSVLRDMIDDVRANRPHLKPDLRWLMNDFTYERRGLTAMASFVERTAMLSASSARDAATGLSKDGSLPSQAAPHRRADVTVEAYDAFGVLRPMHEHERQRALVRGWRYRLRVHIGRPDPETSAVVGAVPDFDNLLPPPDGTRREIDVVVFPKTFELLSPAMQTIELPLEGESAPVHFELRAPQRCGPVDLRIAFYWKNNLLQSYVLEADVTEGDGADKVRMPLTVKLGSAGIDRFDDIVPLRQRALSVALNHDIAPGTHTVMVKGSAWQEQVQLSSEEMGQTMRAFHVILKAASAPVPDSFDASVRKMAALGGRIWNMLSLNNRGDVAVLDTLQSASNQVLQFVRHGSGRPFPWQAVYDYVLPQGEAFSNASICYADKPPSDAWLPNQKGCPHCPGQDVICIEGFWIARHRFELLSEDLYKGMTGVARATQAGAPRENPLVLLGVGTSSLASDALVTALETMLKNDLAHIVPADAPVAELLWKEDRRPAILAVLSHLLEGDEALNLPARMSAFESVPESSGASISTPVLARQRRLGPWAEPHRPMVLLLACQSARQEVGELTSLTDSFLACGAAAVAGTEWDVTTETVSAFAQHLIEHTAVATPQASLGDAMKQFALSSLRTRSISAFIFTVYGNADLTIGRP